MKKGFTLIELLIVMVIVTILVTVAVPMYKTSMEKGRALEAISNAADISDTMNVFYIRNGNKYYIDSPEELLDFVLGSTADGGVAGITADKYFEGPDIAVNSAQKSQVILTRSTGSYSIKFVNDNRRPPRRSCSGYDNY